MPFRLHSIYIHLCNLTDQFSTVNDTFRSRLTSILLCSICFSNSIGKFYILLLHSCFRSLQCVHVLFISLIQLVSSVIISIFLFIIYFVSFHPRSIYVSNENGQFGLFLSPYWSILFISLTGLVVTSDVFLHTRLVGSLFFSNLIGQFYLFL